MSLNWVANRLREPSTWRGIVWILTAAGASLSPDAWAYITTIGMAAAGLIGVLTNEKSTQVEIQLPPIDLIGKSQTVRTDDDGGVRAGNANSDFGQLRESVPPVDYVRGNTSEAADRPGFNG